MKVLKSILIPLISITIITGFVSISYGTGDEGKKIFGAKKCGDCHATNPSKVASIEDWEKKKGPDLWFAGSKFQKEWLEKWLKSPAPIRGIKWNTLEVGSDKHPSLSEKEADEVAEYLMDLKDKDVAAGSAPATVKKIQAKILFEKKNACYSCHQVKGSGGKILGGVSGPTLIEAKHRLNPDWVLAFLKNPGKYEPKGLMPNFSHLTDGDIATLAGYMRLLE